MIPKLTKEQYEMFVKHFTSSTNNDRMVHNANTTGYKNSEDDWIIDSASTDHITFIPHLLENKKITLFEPHVVIPNGDSIHVERKRECTLPGGVKLLGVLYVPDFKCNLLSVGRISNDLQCAVTFFSRLLCHVVTSYGELDCSE